MATKLTLRLDESVIRDAKRAARVRGVSLSEMVSGYFRAVSKEKAAKTEATPVLAEISGILRRKVDANKLPARSAFGVKSFMLTKSTLIGSAAPAPFYRYSPSHIIVFSPG